MGCGKHGLLFCLPCFQAEVKDLKAVILEFKDREADLKELLAPPADPQVPAAEPPGPRPCHTAAARQTLQLYRRLQYRVREGKLAKSVPPMGAPAGALANYPLP